MKKVSKVANVRKRGNRKKKEKPERKRRREPKFDFHSPIQFNSIEGDENKNRPTNSIKIPSPPTLSRALSLHIYIYMRERVFVFG